jgi:hypothetical protein
LKSSFISNFFHSGNALKSKKKTSTSISVIAIAFFCCQLPIRIFLCWSYYQNLDLDEENFKLINTLSNLATIIYFLHCISNSIIYNILSTKFRNAFIRIILFRKRENKLIYSF